MNEKQKRLLAEVLNNSHLDLIEKFRECREIKDWDAGWIILISSEFFFGDIQDAINDYDGELDKQSLKRLLQQTIEKLRKKTLHLADGDDYYGEAQSINFCVDDNSKKAVDDIFNWVIQKIVNEAKFIV